MKDLRSRECAAVLSLLAACSISANIGYAQAAAATTTTTTSTTVPTTEQVTSSAPSTDQPQVLEKYTVTGSNIGNAGEALAIPVSIVSPSDIANSGVETNVCLLYTSIIDCLDNKRLS